MQLVYFPYLNMDVLDKLRIGPFSVLNWSRKYQECVQDEAVREKITALLGMNKFRNEPISGIGVLAVKGSCGIKDTIPVSEIANEIRLLLFLGYMSRHGTGRRGHNAGALFATSEMFLATLQRFILQSDVTTTRNGFVVPIIIGGYRIHETSLHAPPYLLRTNLFVFNQRLVDHVYRLRRQRSDLYRRILLATESIFESMLNDPSVSHNVRILAQARAFEILLELPSREQRRYFKDTIESLCNHANDRRHRICYHTPNGNRYERRTLKGLWAEKFYMLRNHIVHGDRIKHNDYLFRKQRHIEIGTIFFFKCLTSLLNEQYGEKLFWDSITYRRDSDGEDMYSGFEYDDGEVWRSIAMKSRQLFATRQP